jgi:hypothetical protein
MKSITIVVEDNQYEYLYSKKPSLNISGLMRNLLFDYIKKEKGKVKN